ncbi:transmembrane protein 81 [Sorex araneus]|uniref:transmembrane protein 81 n=1 Tax=Sorex araneus TaxID=42254 RepID=UPI002433EE81|nr:transmembrane protein 81 [Sorex araneus]
MAPLALPFLLGVLAWTLRPSRAATSPRTLAIPEELQEAVGRVIVSATTCSVTCGLGYKEETACEVGPDGVRRKCKTQRLQCLTSWVCGMLHFTVLSGGQFQLSCVSAADLLEEGREAYRFTWRLARGIISTEDEVFRPLRVSSYYVRFYSLREYDSGTYRCDVQLLRNLKPVKRLYFGLRVLPRDLVDLNFHQSLTENQKLIDEGLEVNLDNFSQPARPPWKRKVAVAVGLGVPVGVAVGVLLILALCRWLRSSEGLGPGRPGT